MSLLARRAATVFSSRASSTRDRIRASRISPLSTTQNSCSGSDSATLAKENKQNAGHKEPKEPGEPTQKVRQKTMAELDEELKLKMEGMSGGGGSAGVEYENGKAEGLKRGVKENMFRVI